MSTTAKLILFGRKIGVLGMAASGKAAANLARSLGARVLVSDRGYCRTSATGLAQGIETEYGGHSARLLDSEIIIKSPGIHQNIDILKNARKKKIPVWSEIELAARLINPARMIAITGTNGKTTTTVLAGEIFKKNGDDTVVAGNIGAPLAAQVENVGSQTTLILEVSSYQLEDSPTFHPNVSAVLNITPDHLEHHHTMAKYTAAKMNIFARQTRADFCLLNYDDARCRAMAKKTRARIVFFSATRVLRSGLFYRGDTIVFRLPGRRGSIDGSLLIPGRHNRENALAVAGMALVSGVKPEVIEQVLRSFPGVEHRIELVRSIRGVHYYNDSKATNVDSTRVALAAFTQPVWLILGGRDKGAPYAPLKKLIRSNVKGILLIGESAERIKKELAGTTDFYACGTLKKAVRKAASIASAGDAVLLSPACASFDQFKNFEDRGRQFKEIVMKIGLLPAGSTARAER